MFFAKISTVGTLILAVLSPTSCTPVHETNAQRMARGLPPSPPKFGRTIPGREAKGPTPAWAAKRTSTSPVPPITYTGRIQARNDDGSALGIVRNSNSSWTIGGLNFLGPDQELHVSFTAPQNGKGPFDILATNPLFPAPFYVGASSPSETNSLEIGSRNTVSFTNTEQTPPDSIPVKSTIPDRPGFVESAIWSINPGTKELKAQFVNPDKSKPPTIIAYDIRENALFFTGDIDAYNKDNDTPASAIKFYLVSV